MVDELISNKCITIFENPNNTKGDMLISSEIHLIESANKYVNFFDNKFVVKGEKFTNDELINAVKIAFPERFI